MVSRQHSRANILRILIAVGLFITLSVFIGSNHTNKILAADSGPEKNPDNTASEISNTNTLANCRYGVTSDEVTAHLVPTLGAGAFYKFNEPNWYGPLPENDAELLHMVKIRQKKSSGEYLDGWYLDGFRFSELANYVRDDLGAIWIVGNEVERGPNPGETWTARTGDMYPDVYAEAYHDIYHFIKGIDPTARVANAGLIQITPMRLQYLDKVWDAYEQQFGENMPVDVWTIHTYVLPELTPDGLPNNIASAALDTDVALGKRASGGDGSLCQDDMVYCFAEHDDLSILNEQIVAMRQWMKERGERNKPLIVTEYGTLYHYIELDDGRCGGKFDEYGSCFEPERVTQFLKDSFEYFDEQTIDANLGLPSDDYRLVQQWIWYTAYAREIATSNLLTNWNSKQLTMMGRAFRDHVWAEPTYVNLTTIDEDVTGVVTDYFEDDTATATLAVKVHNNGNVAVDQPFTVTFYSDEALTQPIGSTIVANEIHGCASDTHMAEIEWNDLPKGTHPFWIKIDSQNDIDENKGDNVFSGQVDVTGPVYDLQVEIIHDGLGEGGIVTVSPNALTHPEGTIVKLTAVPFEGWSFGGWSGAITGNSPNAQVEIFSDTYIQATFIQDQYKLDLNIIGGGDVQFISGPVKDTYLYGEQIELLAIPEEGWRFYRWWGDITTKSPSIKITFESDIELNARFLKLLDTVTDDIFLPIIASSN